MAEERLQKLISQAGIASRRAAEDLIRQGRVSVNGKLAQVGDKADLARDEVKVDGVTLKPPQFTYYLLHAAQRDQQQPSHNERRRLVRELIPHEGTFHRRAARRGQRGADPADQRRRPGRPADAPRYGHTKTYHVWVVGLPRPKR